MLEKNFAARRDRTRPPVPVPSACTSGEVVPTRLAPSTRLIDLPQRPAGREGDPSRESVSAQDDAATEARSGLAADAAAGAGQSARSQLAAMRRGSFVALLVLHALFTPGLAGLTRPIISLRLEDGG